MIRRPPRSTPLYSSAASDVYKRQHKDGHNELARLLVEKEVIFAEDVERIFGKRPWTSRSEEIMALEATAKPVEVTEDFEEKNSSDSEEKEKEKKEA